jgi:hypothetical protein
MPGDTKISTSGARVLRSVHLRKRKQEAKQSQEATEFLNSSVWLEKPPETGSVAELLVWGVCLRTTPGHESIEKFSTETWLR